MTNQALVSLHTPLFQLAFIFTPAYAHRDFAPSTLFSPTTTNALLFQNPHFKFDLRTDWIYLILCEIQESCLAETTSSESWPRGPSPSRARGGSVVNNLRQAMTSALAEMES